MKNYSSPTLFKQKVLNFILELENMNSKDFPNLMTQIVKTMETVLDFNVLMIAIINNIWIPFNVFPILRVYTHLEVKQQIDEKNITFCLSNDENISESKYLIQN